MENFLRKNDMLVLLDVFVANGVNDQNFYLLDNQKIVEMLSHEPLMMLSFVSKFNYSKGVMSNSIDKSIIIEEMDVDNEIIQSNNLNNLSMEENRENREEIESNIGAGEFNFVQNNLFHFLNAPDNLFGQMILAKYKNQRICDHLRLRDVIVNDLLVKASHLNYKVKSEVFKAVAAEIIELFPTEELNFYYTPYTRSPTTNETVGARGCLYNLYRTIRGQLRDVGLLTSKKTHEEDCDDNSQEDESESTLNCLTDPKRDNYSQFNVIQEWNNTFPDRIKAIEVQQRKKKKLTLQGYFKSFPCLCPPLGITLLELDFEKIIGALGKKSKVSNNVVTSCASLFNTTWPALAVKLLAFFENTKRKDVKTLLTKHQELIKKGICTSEIALLLLPLCMNIIKTFKVNAINSNSSNPNASNNGTLNTDSSDGGTLNTSNDGVLNTSNDYILNTNASTDNAVQTANDGTPNGNVTLTKQEISSCFILQVEVPDHFQTAIKEHEKFLKDLKQECHPYVIWQGKLGQKLEAVVVLNGKLYSYDNPIKAVEACLKCLTALHSWPYVTDFLWAFVQKSIYGLDPNSTYAVVTRLISDLKKKKVAATV